MEQDRQPDGMTMEPQETWRLFGVHDARILVAHLGMLFPRDSVLYLEGTHISEDIQEFVRLREPPEVVKVAKGSIGPCITFMAIRPWDWETCEVLGLHMLLTDENLNGLVSLMREQALTPEVGDHLHVYKGETMLMEGHDWTDGVFYVTGEMPEEKI